MLKPTLCLLMMLAATLQAADPYVKPNPIRIVSKPDQPLRFIWQKSHLEASDSVLVRRLYLGLAGRLPTADEARAYVNSTEPNKYENLVDQLLNSDGFADYWTLHWCDTLRIKSEFPINLWPNAVYGYQRRIRAFLKNNESYDRFARALLTSSGSNFRTPEVNFYRAMADRSPASIARTVSLTFWSNPQPPEFAKTFEAVKFKSTKEWKEEIVYWQADGDDKPWNTVAEAVIAHPDFARAAANRVWFWLFGHALTEDPDNIQSRTVNPELLEYLASEFVKNGYDFRQLCRNAVTTAAYRAAFPDFPVRRLDAEVLDDAICDLTGAPRRYASVIPEPFTFLPPDARSITIADGSLSSSFLILFGRPARDSGMLAERNNEINAKQRLWLFNSGELYRNLSKIPRRDELKKLPFPKKVDELYWMFYSRPPTDEERDTIVTEFNQLKGTPKWRFPQDLCWILVNSKEFLYQH